MGILKLAINLEFRQHRKLKEKVVPAALEKIIDQSQFEKANAYGLDKSSFNFFTSIVGQIQTSLVLTLNLLPYLWEYSQFLMLKYTGVWFGEAEITQSIIFVGIITILSTLLNLPMDLYQNFVIEEKHGFNKLTWALYLKDQLITLMLIAVIGTPFLAGFLKIIDYFGDSFFFYVWLFIFSFQILLITIFPTFIQPLFNTFTPLEDGSLRTKLNELANKISFPLTKIFVIDGSKRSSHSNAYLFGFFKNKRIVLFDTLMKHCEEEEICGILGHELGHWALSHVLKTFVISSFYLFSVFYMFSLFIKNPLLYTSFGFLESQPILIGFLLFNYIFVPYDAVMTFLMNRLSRKHEFEADKYSESLGYAEVLKSGLIKIHTKNMGNANPDSLYSAYHYSHPPLIERLNALNSTNKKED
ncbi:hypothetical protein HDU92_004574 [Lobulomyces angularis]|nr:hypothetical protein HDU92_004574 [Lobulomyces angularis]